MRPFDEEQVQADADTRLQTPIGAAVTTRLAQKMLANYCGKLPGCDRCVFVRVCARVFVASCPAATGACL